MRMSKKTWLVAVLLVFGASAAGLWFQYTRSWLYAPIAQLTDRTVYVLQYSTIYSNAA
jgi:hypothetical protein